MLYPDVFIWGVLQIWPFVVQCMVRHVHTYSICLPPGGVVEASKYTHKMTGGPEMNSL